MTYRNATEMWQDRIESLLTEDAEDLEKDAEDLPADASDKRPSMSETMNLYDDPEDKKKEEGQRFDPGIEKQHIQSDRELLDRSFSGTSAAAQAERKTLSSLFQHAASGNFLSRRSLLPGKQRNNDTLMGKVREKIGRH